MQRPWCTVISNSSLGMSQSPSPVPNQGLGCRRVGQDPWRKQSYQFSACWAKAQTLSVCSVLEQAKCFSLEIVISSWVPPVPFTAWEQKQDMCRYRFSKLCPRGLVAKVLLQLGFHLDRYLKQQLLALMCLCILAYKDGRSSWDI